MMRVYIFPIAFLLGDLDNCIAKSKWKNKERFDKKSVKCANLCHLSNHRVKSKRKWQDDRDKWQATFGINLHANGCDDDANGYGASFAQALFKDDDTKEHAYQGIYKISQTRV